MVPIFPCITGHHHGSAGEKKILGRRNPDWRGWERDSELWSEFYFGDMSCVVLTINPR